MRYLIEFADKGMDHKIKLDNWFLAKDIFKAFSEDGQIITMTDTQLKTRDIKNYW